MDWFNENAGIMTLILLIVSVIAFVFIIIVTMTLKNSIAVQRLKMVGFYSKDVASRENYAEFTVGNRSLNDVSIKEIGIKNGKINLDFTALYMQKAGLNPGARIVIDQRSSLTFRMTEEELATVYLDTPKGKKLHRLRLYIVDLPGNVYYGNMHAVRKLLVDRDKRLEAESAASAKAKPAQKTEKPQEPQQNS